MLWTEDSRLRSHPVRNTDSAPKSARHWAWSCVGTSFQSTSYTAGRLTELCLERRSDGPRIESLDHYQCESPSQRPRARAPLPGLPWVPFSSLTPIVLTSHRMSDSIITPAVSQHTTLYFFVSFFHLRKK